MHIAEKYTSLARDAMSSGDTVAAENYLQHAEHYNRIILAAQAQNLGMPGLEGPAGMNGGGRFNQSESYQRDYDGDDEGDTDDYVPQQRPFPERPERAERAAYNQNQPQPYIPQNAFPQIQPQPVVPAPNGLASPPGEPYSVSPDSERMPRRRRRRPIGDLPMKPINGRNGNGGPQGAPAPNGTAPANTDPDSDEA
jgi:hypothetical protein